jgi:hypothetical protein
MMSAYQKLHPRARTIGQAYGEENEAAINVAGEYTAGGERFISSVPATSFWSDVGVTVAASGSTASKTASAVPAAATIFGLTPIQAVLAGVAVWLVFFRK